jgi:hypothetical protein
MYIVRIAYLSIYLLSLYKNKNNLKLYNKTPKTTPLKTYLFITILE